MNISLNVFFFNNTMNSPMVPQWLERSLGVKRHRHSKKQKTKLRRADLEFGPICRHMGPGYLPLSLLCLPREYGPPMSYDRASATCVCEYTHCYARYVHFFAIWVTVLLLVLSRINTQHIASLRKAPIW